MTALRKAAATLVATALGAAGLLGVAGPAQANGDLLWFGGPGKTTTTVGANAPVRIGGKLYFKNEGCPEGGVPDFFYPTSDVYVVLPGTESGKLVDATGGPPNTVVSYGSIFDDEIVGMTAPTGKLAEGTYDVVYDTCQDGMFDPDVDTVFHNALTVTMPAGDIPPPDASLLALKQASYDEYVSWKQTHKIMDEVWKQVEKALKGGCKAGNPTACALKYGNYFSPIKEQFDALLLNQGLHYLAIYEDPPNSDFAHPVQLPAVAATDAATSALAGEDALTQGLLRAVEAYKGAQTAGDRRWALVHAREARDLYGALQTQLTSSDAQLQALSDSFGDDADAALTQAWQWSSRVQQSGLTADERKTLRENGLSAQDVTAFEQDVRDNRTSYVRSATVKDALAADLSAHGRTASALAQGAQGCSGIVDALSSSPATPQDQPSIGAGGPYTATEGAPTTLGATGPAGTYGWDLDGNGSFDDAAGASPSVTFSTEGSHVVGVRLTDSAGRTAYSWTTVDVARTGALPSVGSTTPSAPLLTVTTGSTTPFSVAPTDDRGTPAVTWTVDGTLAGTGNTLAWKAPATPGSSTVVATATDSDGHAVRRSWDVDVHRPDADGDGWTATTDCDDTVAVVHPGATEVLGNGVDDDCDPGTPDSAPGGLTGTPWGWGINTYGQAGTGTTSNDLVTLPVPTALGDDVVQVEAGDRTGYAVGSDGSLRAWGYGIGGLIGDGTGNPSAKPVAVHGIDGAGVLGGVTQVDASTHALARRTDGSVAAWGSNANGQLGDGTTTTRYFPVQVLSAPGVPLTGVTQVAAGASQSYALRPDGTVVGWGYVTCDGSITDGVTQYATPVPGLTHVRKVVAVKTNAFFLLDDGRVLSCGSPDQMIGRTYGAQGTASSAYLPLPVPTGGARIVDVSGNGGVGLLVTDDGRLLAWGKNTSSSLDVLVPAGYSVQFPTPVPLPAGPPAVRVMDQDTAAAFVLRGDGSVLVFGGNTWGVAGVGSTDSAKSTNPPAVLQVPGRVVVGLSSSAWSAYALTRPADETTRTPASWVTASVGDGSVPEATGGSVTVTLSQPARNDVQLGYSLSAGTAGPDDVALVSGTVTVPAGSTTASIPVTTKDDALDEDDETATVELTSASLGVQLARAQGTVTVLDDDAAPTASVDATSVQEGDTSLTDVPVHLHLSAPSGKEVVVHWATADGTATAGSDYVAAGGESRFAPGETDHVVHLAVVGDRVVEPDEAFSVTVDGASAAVAIADDDPLTAAVTGPRSVKEGTGGTTPVVYTIAVSPAPLAGVTVDVPWSVVEPDEGGGDQPGDVLAASGTVHLTAQAPAAQVTAQVVGDAVVEGAEHLQLALGTPVASDGRTVVSDGSVTTTILDDDTVATPPPPPPPATLPFTGFFQPVDNTPTVNVVKAGSAVPVKWSLSGYRGTGVLANGSPASAQHGCTAASTDDLEQTATPGASTLSYDAPVDQYQYVWKAEKSWAGTCRTFVLTLSDGTRHTAEFRFK